MFIIVDQGGLPSEPVYVTLSIVSKDDHQTVIALTPAGGVSCTSSSPHHNFLKQSLMTST